MTAHAAVACSSLQQESATCASPHKLEALQAQSKVAEAEDRVTSAKNRAIAALSKCMQFRGRAVGHTPDPTTSADYLRATHGPADVGCSAAKSLAMFEIRKCEHFEGNEIHHPIAHLEALDSQASATSAAPTAAAAAETDPQPSRQLSNQGDDQHHGYDADNGKGDNFAEAHEVRRLQSRFELLDYETAHAASRVQGRLELCQSATAAAAAPATDPTSTSTPEDAIPIPEIINDVCRHLIQEANSCGSNPHVATEATRFKAIKAYIAVYKANRQNAGNWHVTTDTEQLVWLRLKSLKFSVLLDLFRMEVGQYKMSKNVECLNV